MHRETPLEQKCRDHGIRLHRRRLVILRALSDSHDHPTAEQLHRRARAVMPDISMATVYRTLALLLHHGLIFSFDFGDGPVRYEDAAQGAHDHLIDADSGEIFNFCESAIEQSIRDVLVQRGCDLRSYRLEIRFASSAEAGRSDSSRRPDRALPPNSPWSTR